jgi:hypothetical protein
MSETTAQDVAISDFRVAHSEALNSAAHPLHVQRLGELSALYEQKFSAPAEIAAPTTTAEEHRLKHDAVLNDKTHPDHAVRVDQLNKITERDLPADAAFDVMAPATSTADYQETFDKAKNSVPLGSDLEPDPATEVETGKVFMDNGVSPHEASVLVGRYMESQRSDFSVTTPEQAMDGLRRQFGDKADAALEGVGALLGQVPAHLAEAVRNTALGNDIFTLAALANIAKRKGLWS